MENTKTMQLDVEIYFDPEQWKILSPYERQRYSQILKNYLDFVSLGLDIPKPDFLVDYEVLEATKNRKQRTMKNVVKSSTIIASAQEYDKLLEVYKEIREKGFTLSEIKFTKKSFQTIAGMIKDLQMNFDKMLKHSEQAHRIYVLETLPAIKQGNQSTEIVLESTRSKRYPTRHIKRVDYTEEDIPEDYYIYCDRCEREWEGGFCPYHGPLLNCLDVVVPKDKKNLMRAMQTTPIDWLCIRQSAIPDAGMGVWSIKCIPIGVRFGPYEGVETVDGNSEGYCWQIRKDRRITHFVDGKPEGLSNWMRYVNCSRNIIEQNLVAFQYLGKIYYRTIKHIYPKTELLIWYGDAYAERLGIDPKEYKTPLDKIQLSANNFPCLGCHMNFSTPIYMENHRKRCMQFRTAIYNNTQAKDQIQNLIENQKEKKLVEDNILSNSDHSFKIRNNESTDVQSTNNMSSVVKNHKINALNINGVHKNERHFNCLICEATFTQAGDLKRHISGVHKNERPFKCLICKAAFIRAGHLNQHISGVHKNERPFKCLVCKATFTQAGDLKRHISGVHKNERPFKCLICKATFTEAGNLKRHISGVHKNERPFKCLICKATFTRAGSLKMHISGVHKNERPFKCLICKATFTRVGSLKMHISGVHKNERPFKCLICKATFTQAGHLKQHISGVHKKERPIKCVECPATFTNSGNLNRHIRSKHKNEH